jgi:hypothetical protein
LWVYRWTPISESIYTLNPSVLKIFLVTPPIKPSQPTSRYVSLKGLYYKKTANERSFSERKLISKKKSTGIM